MNYDLLVVIVVVNAIITLLLWRTVARKLSKPPRLNKKAAKLLWDSKPIEPKHERAKAIGDEFPDLADETDRSFFVDFKEFADVVNWWLAEEYVRSRWRLQELPDTDLRLTHSDSPTFGRRYALFYNQTRCGTLEISSAYEYSTEAAMVYTNIEIEDVRLLGFSEVTDILDGVARHVVDPRPKSEEYIATRQTIHSALTNALWDNYRISKFDELDGQGWGELAVSFHGSAEWYIRRRLALREKNREGRG